jgi:hypothetical protein
MKMNCLIRNIQQKDKFQWQELYKDYANFYNVEMNSQILETVWNWLNDKNHVVKGIVCEIDENIIAFTHYRSLPRP